MSSFGRSRSSVLLSGVIFVISCIASFYCYRKLIAEQRPPGAFAGVEYGKHGYLILSEERCVGWLSYELEYSGSYSLISDAHLRYAVGGSSSELTLRSGFAFNSLDQMSGMYVRIVREGEEVAVRSDRVNPIRFRIEGSLGGTKVSFQRTLPGPIELFETSNGTLSLRSRYLPSIDSQLGVMLERSPIQDAIPYELDRVDATEEKDLQNLCAHRGIGELQLDRALSLVTSAAQKLMELSI